MNKNHLTTAVGLILSGVLCIIFKGEIIQWLMTIIGVIIVVSGIFNILAKLTDTGIIKIIIGALLIAMGWIIGVAILYVLAILFTAYGVMNLYNLIKAKIRSILLYIMPLTQLAVGILLLFNMGGTIAAIFIAIGICLIVNGVIELIGVLLTKE